MAGDGSDPLARYDDNGNGRITCAEARAHGIAPMKRSNRPTTTCATVTAMGLSVSRDVRATGGSPGRGPMSHRGSALDDADGPVGD